MADRKWTHDSLQGMARSLGVTRILQILCRCGPSRAELGLVSVSVAFIILAAFLVRVLPLSRYVTPDEPAWVYRSIRFADALSAREWTTIPSTGHPGVTTMWLGAAGVGVRQWLDPTGSIAHLDWIRRLAWLSPENGEAFRHLAVFLPHGRVAVAAVTSLGLLVIYGLITRLFGRGVALVVVGLLAFDPFLVGHSGLLHTDALLATFFGISALCLLVAARGDRYSWVWSLASGTAGGLALLTKSLAALLPLFAGVALGSTWLLRRIRLRRALGLFALWVTACLAVYTALFPAMWEAPWQTLRDLYGAPAYQSTTALMPTFFAGRTALRHGPEFYAAALPFRLSPVVLVGVVLSAWTFATRKSLRVELFWLWLFAAGYAIMLAFSVKKYDRYLLPVFPLLATAAALGYTWRDGPVWASPTPPPGVEASATSERHRLAEPMRRRLGILLIVLQLLLLLPFAVCPLTGFNPLLGGPWVASHVLSADWGEGMGAAAHWLNERPDSDRLTVAAISVPSFAPLFAGQTVSLKQGTLADYAVVSADGTVSNEASGQPAPHIIRFWGLAHAAVVTNTAPYEQAAYLAARVKADGAVLLDADTPLLRRYDGPGRLVSFADLPDEAAVATRLAELSARHTHLWLVADPAAAPITAAHLRQGLAALGTPVTSDTVGGAVISGFVLQREAAEPGRARAATFGHQIVLVDALLPTMPAHGAFPVHLRWRVEGPASTDLHASLYLEDASGHLWTEVGHLIVNGVTVPTSAWTVGEWADDKAMMKRPAHVQPGVYKIKLTVTDAEGRQLGAQDSEGEFRGVRLPLGHVEIAPPIEPEGEVDCVRGSPLAAGDLLICLPDLPPQAVPSGSTLTVALTWSALERPEGDYAVRWILTDAGGQVMLEEIDQVALFETSHWRAGDSFEARYDLRMDPAVPAAEYALALEVLGPDGSALWTEREHVTTVEVLARDRQFKLPAEIKHALDLTLGDVVHLRGFDIDPEPTGAPAEGSLLHPGGTLDLILYWQADGPADLDYTVFVHFLGPDGRLHGQVDRFPAGGSAPTTSWAPGQVIVDELVLPVDADAPPGAYQIAVGMYDAASGDHLPVSSSSGRTLGEDQFILPVTFGVARGEQ